MSTTMIQSYVLHGLNAVPVTIAVDLREEKVYPPMLLDRVQSAILAAGFKFPPRLAVEIIHPNDLKVTTTALDLPIAVGILVATGQVANFDRNVAYFGELSMMGGVVEVRGTLAVALQAKVDGRILVGLEAAAAAASIGGEGYVLTRLSDLRHTLPRATPVESPALRSNMDMRGNEEASRTLDEAARTCRPVVLLGPPGCGQTKLATYATALMPPLSDAEAIEVATIQNVAGFRTIRQGVMSNRPFRAPHYTISPTGLVGGTTLRPGEATLAHRGVLFLDEYSNFSLPNREVVDRLIVDKYVTPLRTGGNDRFPADSWVIIAAKPCPCGNHEHPSRSCTCSKEMIEQYIHPIQEFVRTHDAVVIRLTPTA